MLKVPTVPGSAFRYVWGIQWNRAMVPSTTQLQAEGSMIAAIFLPLCM